MLSDKGMGIASEGCKESNEADIHDLCLPASIGGIRLGSKVLVSFMMMAVYLSNYLRYARILLRVEQVKNRKSKMFEDGLDD